MNLLFDPNRALKMALLANSVYNNFNFQVQNSQGLTIEDDSEFDVAFAGSKDILDFIEDAEAVPVCPDIADLQSLTKFHVGFLTMYLNIREAAIQRSMGIKKPIFVTGHSAGGPSACAHAFELKKLGFPVDSVWTFGCPRWLTEPAAQAYEVAGIRTLNFIHGEDFVPDLPPGVIFRRPGIDIYLSEDGLIIPNRDPELGAGFWKRFVDKVEDHLLVATDGYIRCFQNMAATA